LPFCWHYHSRFPALNVDHCNEAVATDTVFSDTPAIDNGATMAQNFYWSWNFCCWCLWYEVNGSVYKYLEDNIRKRGAMSKLISDWSEVELATKPMISCMLMLLMTGSQSPTISTKTLWNVIGELSKLILTTLWIGLEHLHLLGCYV